MTNFGASAAPCQGRLGLISAPILDSFWRYFFWSFWGCILKCFICFFLYFLVHFFEGHFLWRVLFFNGGVPIFQTFRPLRPPFRGAFRGSIWGRLGFDLGVILEHYFRFFLYHFGLGFGTDFGSDLRIFFFKNRVPFWVPFWAGFGGAFREPQSVFLVSKCR